MCEYYSSCIKRFKLSAKVKTYLTGAKTVWILKLLLKSIYRFLIASIIPSSIRASMTNRCCDVTVNTAPLGANRSSGFFTSELFTEVLTWARAVCVYHFRDGGACRRIENAKLTWNALLINLFIYCTDIRAFLHYWRYYIYYIYAYIHTERTTGGNIYKH